MAEATTGGTENKADDVGAFARPTMAGFNWRSRPDLPDPPVGNLGCLAHLGLRPARLARRLRRAERLYQGPAPRRPPPALQTPRPAGVRCRDRGAPTRAGRAARPSGHPHVPVRRIPIGHAVYLGDLRQLAWHHATGYRQLLAPGHLAAGPDSSGSRGARSRREPKRSALAAWNPSREAWRQLLSAGL